MWQETRDISIQLTNQMLGNDYAFSACYKCEVMYAMSTSLAVHTYYKQQYSTLFIGWLTADVTISQGHLGVKQVEFSIAHISCSVWCIELKLGTNDEEGITQQNLVELSPLLLRDITLLIVDTPVI